MKVGDKLKILTPNYSSLGSMGNATERLKDIEITAVFTDGNGEEVVDYDFIVREPVQKVYVKELNRMIFTPVTQ